MRPLVLRSLVFTLVLAPLARADDGGADFSQLSLEELLEVSVASGHSSRLEDAPGVVSVITRDDIVRSGARDIDDLLQFVPGFQFGGDLQATVGYGFRGLWGLEGKVLQMVDGLEQNEVYYNSIYVQNRVPIDEIERIEIIRGPGSAMYGGAAEYAVINIVTRTGAQLRGASASATYGQLRGGWGRATLDLQAGEKFATRAGDVDVSLKVFTGRVQRGEGLRDYPNGARLETRDAYRQDPLGVNFALTWKGLTARLQIDRMQQTAQDAYGVALSSPIPFRFDQTSAQLKYAFEPLPGLQLAPEYTYRRSNAYTNDSAYEGLVDTFGQPADVSWDVVAERHKVALPLAWTPVPSLDLRAGAEYVLEHATSPMGMITPDASAPDRTATSLTRHVAAGYAQGLWFTPLGDFTAGLRLERNEQYGTSAVPRFAWTRRFGALHLKALYSFAYRPPSLGNTSDAASGGNVLHPERTRVAELEAGLRFGEQAVTANVFDIRVEGPIVYAPSEGSYSYANYGQTGSRGFELQYRGNWRRVRTAVTASVYNAGGLNSVERFAVQGDPRELAAFARFKGTALASVHALGGLWVTPSIVCLGPRTTFSSANGTADALGQVRLDTSVVANLMLSWTDLFAPGVSVLAGVHDLFAASQGYLPAYDQGRDRMPGPSRELVLRVGYQASF